LGAPVAWALEFVMSYAITQHTCSTGKLWELYLLSFSSIAVAGLALMIAFRTFLRVPQSASQDSSHPASRSRFAGALGLMMSLLFTVAIVAGAVPRFILSPCE
jgi:hypothetical protein